MVAVYFQEHSALTAETITEGRNSMSDRGFAEHWRKQDADAQKKRLEKRGYKVTISKVTHKSTLNDQQFKWRVAWTTAK